MGRPTVIVMLVLLLVAGAAAAPFDAAPGPVARAGDRYRSTSEEVYPGLTFTRMVDTRGPNRIFVLRADLTTALTLDVALANEKIPGHETTSSMATRHGAVAAINGDFTLLPSDKGAGHPLNTFAEDGLLRSSPLMWGRNFSLSLDEKVARFGHAPLRMTLLQADSQQEWSIRRWNDFPGRGGFVVHTRAGGSTFRPPRDACAARLLRRKPHNWDAAGEGVMQTYQVDAVNCSSDRLARKKGIVVAARRGTAKAKKLHSSLESGELVEVGWSQGRKGVLDTIGGNPVLVKDGQVVDETCYDSYFCFENPRTGVGATKDGEILFVVVDGRRPGYSEGMTLLQFARLMKHLGAVSALNLDGGGSSTMFVKGKVRNVTSDGPERPVGSALLLLPGRDEQEQVPLPHAGTDPGPDPQPDPSPTDPLPVPLPIDPPATPKCLWLTDPGSTGGLIDAVARGEIKAKRRLRRAVKRALDIYRDPKSCDIPG